LEFPNPRHPFLSSIAISAAAIAIVILLSASAGGDPVAAGHVVFWTFLGGVLLGIWAITTRAKWSIWGYLWRFIICWVGAAIWGTFVNTSVLTPLAK